MNRRSLYSSAVLVVLMVGAAYAQKKDVAEPSKVYKEPKDVFEAARTAAKNNDYKAFYHTLTPDSADLLTGQLAMVGVMIKSFSEFDKTNKTKDQVKPVFDAMTRHGLGELMKSPKPLDPKAKPPEQLKALREMIKPVKSQPDFVADMMKAMSKINPKGEALSDLANDKLENVKVNEKEGKATGDAVGKRGGKDSKVALQFEKIGGSWRIVLPQPKARDVDD